MIHKNIYSSRMKKIDKVDPYIYKIEDKPVINSFLILLSKQEEFYLIKSLIDFCETKGEYLSPNLQGFILYRSPYVKNYGIKDIEFLFNNYVTEDILDYFDIIIAVMNKKIINHKDYYQINFLSPGDELFQIKRKKEKFVQDLNERFEHNNLGYCIVNDVIATKESDFLHQEVVSKPLTLLINEEFKGASEEFTNAIENYTKKDYENCVLEACKAFESTIKSILDNRNVTYNPNGRLNQLIEALRTEGLFDSYLDSYFSNLNTILNSSVNTIRNRLSGHGDGKDINEVERSYASFALNLAGSCIVFLLDRYYEAGGKK